MLGLLGFAAVLVAARSPGYKLLLPLWCANRPTDRLTNMLIVVP